MRIFSFVTLFLISISSCAESGLEQEEVPIRLQNEDRRPTIDMGSGDRSSQPQEDVVEDEDQSQPDAGCSVDCEPDTMRCSGRDVERCNLVEGCPQWTVQMCPQSQSCDQGTCVSAPECTDMDQDGYGKNCPAGPDCDDADRDIHPGAPEICDSKDNNCDTTIDEGFSLGGLCTLGMGTCQADGFLKCSPDGASTICDAQPRMTETEVCDGIDNNCDGNIDEGDVCAFCANDLNEPNNVIGLASMVTESQPFWSALCPGDVDYYTVNTIAGRSYRFSVKFPEALSDLKMEGFGNTTLLATADGTGDDHALVWTAAANTTYAFGVTNKDAAESIYRVSFRENANIACSGEDGFGPNQDINTAVTMLARWRTEAYICSGTQDWYRIKVTAGDSIFIEADGLFTDVDIYLWGDVNRDNQYTVVRQAAGLGDSEFLRFTATYTGNYFFHIDAPGDYGAYDIRWEH